MVLRARGGLAQGTLTRVLSEKWGDTKTAILSMGSLGGGVPVKSKMPAHHPRAHSGPLPEWEGKAPQDS